MFDQQTRERAREVIQNHISSDGKLESTAMVTAAAVVLLLDVLMRPRADFDKTGLSAGG